MYTYRSAYGMLVYINLCKDNSNNTCPVTVLMISNRNSHLSNGIENNNSDNTDVYRHAYCAFAYVYIHCVACVLINLLFAEGNNEDTACYVYDM